MSPPQSRAGEPGPAHGPGASTQAVPQPGDGHGHGAHEHGPPGDHAHDEHGFLETVRAIGTSQVRRRRRLVRLGLLFFLAAAAALGEGLARTAPLSTGNQATAGNRATAGGPRGLLAPDEDPILRYSVRPGTVIEAFDRFEQHFGPHGVRGSLPPGPRPPAERRLLLVGTDSALGLVWPDDETEAVRLAARVEAHASRPDTSWRGLGLGAPGYTARQAVRAFERAADDLAPDLVVLLLDETMVDTQGAFVDREGLGRRDFLPLPDGLRRFLWRHSALYASIATRYTLAVLDVPDPLTDPRPPNAFARPENQASALAAVAAFGAQCRAREIPCLVFFQSLLRGDGADLDPAARPSGIRTARERVTEMDGRLGQLELPHGTATLDQDLVNGLFDALQRWDLIP